MPIQIRYAAPAQRMISKRAYELFRIQVSPKAIAETSSAVPSTVLATVASPCLDPLRRAGGDDQRYDRPRRNGEDEGDHQEGGEQLWVHGRRSEMSAWSLTSLDFPWLALSVLAIAKQISAPQSCDPVRNPKRQAGEKTYRRQGPL